jgi:hypothetical protein
MRNIDWPPAEIHRIAKTSGKPLEVECAEAFLAAGWKARLGSYYADGAFDVPRELDVLVEKSIKLDSVTEVTARVRALVSCRGFPEERSPLLYSVSEKSVPSYEPRLFVEHRGPWALKPGSQPHGPLPMLEIKSARRALEFADLTTARPIVAFDMIERTETIRIKKKVPQPPEVSYTRMKDGDSSIFKAVDSAIKAAFFWRQEDYQKGVRFVTVNVPVCILSCPFWDACIDRGNVDQPEVFRKGWMVNLYPARPHAAEGLMCLVWSADQLAVLITALDSLFTWFSDEMNNAYRSSKPD